MIVIVAYIDPISHNFKALEPEIDSSYMQSGADIDWLEISEILTKKAIPVSKIRTIITVGFSKNWIDDSRIIFMYNE